MVQIFIHSSYFRPIRNKKSSMVVVTVHDFIYEKFNKGISRKIHLYQKNRALQQADAIICVSENTKDFIEYYPWIDENKIFVVYNGLDTNHKKLPPVNGFTIRGIDLRRNSYLVYIGSRGENVKILILS